MNKQTKSKIKKTALFGILFMASKWTLIAILYNSGFWTYWFLLLFPIADLTAAIFAVRYIKGNFTKFFSRALEENFPKKGLSLFSKVERKNKVISVDLGFIKKPKKARDKRLAFIAYYLGLIKVLEEKSKPYEDIKGLCLEIAKDYAKPKNKIHRWWLKLLPRLADSKLFRRIWKDVAEMDVFEYGINALLLKHNAMTYLPVFQEVDSITSDLKKP